MTLGRVGGVEVKVHWSVLVIFLLLTVGLGAGQLPEAYPGHSDAAYSVAAFVAGVVFFASLLAHEVGHALVARRNGLKVEGITLWMLGGIARIQGEAPSPAAEVRIAGVGPAVSAALAVGFGVLAAVLSSAGVGGLPIGVLAWLAFINALIAVFNVIPAAPLDGGRLLRAFLWWRSGDRVSAAVTASRVGQVFGYVLIALGLVQLISGAGIGGLWLALVGIFLIAAAATEEQQARTREALAGVRVADIMSPDPVVVPEHLTVDALLDRYIFAYQHSAFPVVGPGGRPTGLVTLNRVKPIPPDRRPHVPVQEIACPLDEVPVASPDELVADLLPRLAGCSDGRALVIRDGWLVGVVSPSDITKALELLRLMHRAGPATADR
jgi:Zn-dependent protease